MIAYDLILTTDELDLVDFSHFSGAPSTFHEYELRAYFDEVVKKSLDENEKKVASMLALLFLFNLQVVGGQSVFEPQAIFGNRRSLLPEDFDDKVNNYLADLSDRFNNPFLVSRICDVLWVNYKKKDFAVRAIEAYAAMISLTAKNKIIENPNVSEDDLNDLIFIKEYIARAMYINSRAYSKKESGNDNLKSAIELLYDSQNSNKVFEGFNYLTNIMNRNKAQSDRLQYAINAEAMAEAHKRDKYSEAVKALFITSAKIYEKCNQLDSAKRCKLSAAQITINVAHSRCDRMGKISWLRTALEELRSFGGDPTLITDLKEQLAGLRAEAMNDYITISSEIDIGDLVEDINNSLSNKPLSEIIRKIIIEMPIENIKNIRDEVLSLASKNTFSSLMGMQVHDEGGRLIHKSAPLNLTGDSSDDVIIDNYMRHIDISHNVFINGVFEPARFIVSQEHNISLSTFDAFTALSPAIRPESKEIFNLGFYRLWQGDYIGASYMLIPQMEGILKYVYENSGRDTTRYLDKGLEESTSISILLDKCRSDIESIFSEDLTLTIDLIFNKKGGSSLRHRIAHGNLYSGSCFAETTIYACMLIFYVCAIPMFDSLDKIIDGVPKT